MKINVGCLEQLPPWETKSLHLSTFGYWDSLDCSMPRNCSSHAFTQLLPRGAELGQHVLAVGAGRAAGTQVRAEIEEMWLSEDKRGCL